MRSFTVTALIATGIAGIAAPAQAARAVNGTSAQAATVPAVRSTPAPAHPALARAAQPQPRVPARPAGQPAAHPAAHPQPEPVREQVGAARPEPAKGEPARAAYMLNMTGQAAHWEVAPGQTEMVRWTLINAGERRLEHVQLVASIPAGWTVRDGQGCEHHGAYLGCDIGSLEPGHSAAVVVPMEAQKPAGAVRLTAWSRAAAGHLTIPGPTTSFRVFVVEHHADHH